MLIVAAKVPFELSDADCARAVMPLPEMVTVRLPVAGVVPAARVPVKVTVGVP